MLCPMMEGYLSPQHQPTTTLISKHIYMVWCVIVYIECMHHNNTRTSMVNEWHSNCCVPGAREKYNAVLSARTTVYYVRGRSEDSVQLYKVVGLDRVFTSNHAF